MFRKNYFTGLLLIALCLAGSLAAFAQTLPVSGKVVIKKADGTTEPVKGATVEAYRSDIKGKGLTAKTNKNGEFNFAGLPVGATYIFSISGEKISPTYFPNIRPGTDRLVIDVREGDGKKMTEDEVRAAVAKGTVNSSVPASQATAEQKKAMEENAKANAEYEAAKKKNEDETSTLNKLIKEGDEAVTKTNFDLAVTKFEEGYQLNKTYVGSAPLFLNAKGSALNQRVVVNFNTGAKSTDAAMKADLMTKVKADLQSALTAYSTSYELLKNAPQTEITNPEQFNKSKYNALSGLVETYRLMFQTKADLTKSAEAKVAVDEYLTVETDTARKLKAQMNLGDIMILGGNPQGAVEAYKAALVLSPDNPDALANLGLSQVSAGYNTDGSVNDAMMQEAINNLQKYTDIAPANHSLKASVAETITYLKGQNFKPQKTTGGAKSTGKKKS